MASGSGSDNESNRSISPTSQGPAPTPGYGLDRSRSNSPNYENNDDNVNEGSGFRSRSRSPRSASPTFNKSKSRSRSRSNSADSNQSEGSQRSQSLGSDRSNRSQSVGSNKSGSRKSRSGSNDSNKSGKSRSQTPTSDRSRSKSVESNKSKSSGSHRSKSRSVESKRSQGSRSRSQSADSNRSRSQSAESNKSPKSSRGGSRSRSRSGSKSHGSGTERSRSASPTKEPGSKDNSRSNSPRLEIDAGSPKEQDKRKRESSEEIENGKKNKTGSDSEGEEGGNETSAAALFGDADDISSEDEKNKADSDKDHEKRLSDEDQGRHSEGENDHRPTVEDYDEKENDIEPIPETRIDVEIPKISCDLGRDIHFVKLPNFLSVETRPFDPKTYEDEIDEEETLDEEGRARLKLKVENTIRWRHNIDKDENFVKESNGRFVRWSDGSLSLHLGSEIFDVYKQPLQGDHNHLFIRQGTGLQGQAVFRTKLSFRPHSTESFTHRKMTLSLADRSQKISGIKVLSQVGANPDQDRKSLLKKEEEKLKQSIRAKPRRRGDGGTRAREHASALYREEEGSDEDGAISLNAIKNKYKSGVQSKGGAIYSSDEEGSDFEARRGRKSDKPKALKDSESSGTE